MVQIEGGKYEYKPNLTIKDENGNDYTDNDERTIFFVRGVMETVKKLRWTPDVIHCSGWMTALAPLYIKKAYNEDPFFKNSKVVYSLCNDEFKTPFRSLFADHLKLEGIEDKDLSQINMESIDYVALTKFAIDYSDGVIQSTPVVNPAITDYIDKNNINFLPFVNDEDYADEYLRFYDTIM